MYISIVLTDEIYVLYDYCLCLIIFYSQYKQIIPSVFAFSYRYIQLYNTDKEYL